jgi:hypothetical protein
LRQLAMPDLRHSRPKIGIAVNNPCDDHIGAKAGRHPRFVGECLDFLHGPGHVCTRDLDHAATKIPTRVKLLSMRESAQKPIATEFPHVHVIAWTGEVHHTRASRGLDRHYPQKALGATFTCHGAVDSTRRHDAFMHMSELLKEVIEEVCVISASLREGSEELRAKASRLREYSERLQDGSQSREAR